LHIHTDFRLEENEELDEFLKELLDIHGVESIVTGRYHLDVHFGILFDSRFVGSKCLDLFSDRYINANDEITEEFITKRITDFATGMPSDGSQALLDLAHFNHADA
jgi:hypothetical protein